MCIVVVLALLILFGTSNRLYLASSQLPEGCPQMEFYDQPRQFEKLALSAELDTGSLSF